MIESLGRSEQINQFENLTSPKGLSDGFIHVPEGRPIYDPDATSLQKQYAEINLHIYNRLLGFKKINAKKLIGLRIKFYLLLYFLFPFIIFVNNLNFHRRI